MPLLIIDDLGRELNTPHNRSVFYQIVNYRYEHNTPLVITTNLDVQELCMRYDEAVFSRLAEMCDFVFMKGSDYRLRNHLC